ncbi:MAG: S8 family serine peptidase [Lachnospiraceae bacterium]|nr:S8 family serine peptidase [Lachnospiraceae bacterium]
MKSKKKIIIGIVCIIVIIVLGSVAFRNISYTNSLKSHYVSRLDWAYNNKGQKVKGVSGTKGIDIDIIPFWQKKLDTNSVLVGVIDTGEYKKGKLLKNHIWSNKREKANDGKDNDKNGYIDDQYGWDFYNNDNTIYDNYLYDYHGTYIANEIIKTNPKVQIIVSKFMKGTKGDALDATKAINYAINSGARIINCSWDFYKDEPKMRQLIHDNQNVLFVCAAGNSNLNLDKEDIFPASYDEDNVISVGAVNSQGKLYEYGGYGKNGVDILAPGENINILLPENDKEYVDGTSIATSYVSGAASLLLGAKPDLKPYEIKKVIINGAKKETGLRNKCKSGGILDIYASYLLLK